MRGHAGHVVVGAAIAQRQGAESGGVARAEQANDQPGGSAGPDPGRPAG
ncbi:MAG: hypothetical protein V9H69_03280 [Anaerolineae bacterium]